MIYRFLFSIILILCVGCATSPTEDYSDGGRCYLLAASRMIHKGYAAAGEFYKEHYYEYPKAGLVPWVIEDYGHADWDLTYTEEFSTDEILRCATSWRTCQMSVRFLVDGVGHVEYVYNFEHYSGLSADYDIYGIYFYFDTTCGGELCQH